MYLSHLAIGKRARQSGTAYGGVASRAVDGFYDGNYNHGSVTHTPFVPFPYWEVDLGAEHFIETIVLFNRTDCCSHRLRNFVVFVSRSHIPSVAPRHRKYPGGPLRWQWKKADWGKRYPGGVGGHLQIPVKKRGRYVRIQMVGRGYLSLAEVAVTGK